MKKLLLAAVMMMAVSGMAMAQDYPKWDVFGGYSFMSADLDGGQTWNNYYYDADFFRFNEGDNTGIVHGFDFAVTRNVNSWLGFKGSFSSHYGTVDIKNSTGYYYGYDYDYNEYNQYDYSRQENWSGNTDYRRYTGMFGPEFSYRGNSVFRPFAHMLFGFSNMQAENLDVDFNARREWSYTGEGTSEDWEEWDGQITGQLEGKTGFAMALGGGLDLKAGKHFSIRLIQAEYLPTWDKIAYTADFNGRREEDGDYSRDYWEGFQFTAPTNRFNNIKLSFGVVISF